MYTVPSVPLPYVNCLLKTAALGDSARFALQQVAAYGTVHKAQLAFGRLVSLALTYAGTISHFMPLSLH